MKSFIDIPPLQSPSRAALMNLVTRTKNLIEPMPTYDIETSTWGVWIVPIIVRKLDPGSRSQWCTRRPQKVTAAVKPLLDFITLRADGIDESAHNVNSNRNGNWNPQNSGQNCGQSSSNQPSNFNAGRNKNGNATRGNKRPVQCPDSLCRPPNNSVSETASDYGCVSTALRSRMLLRIT